MLVNLLLKLLVFRLEGLHALDQLQIVPVNLSNVFDGVFGHFLVHFFALLSKLGARIFQSLLELSGHAPFHLQICQALLASRLHVFDLVLQFLYLVHLALFLVVSGALELLHLVEVLVLLLFRGVQLVTQILSFRLHLFHLALELFNLIFELLILLLGVAHDLAQVEDVVPLGQGRGLLGLELVIGREGRVHRLVLDGLVVHGFVLLEVPAHHHEQRLLFDVFFNFGLQHFDVLGLLLHSALVNLVFKLHTGQKLLCVDLEILQLTSQLGIVLDLRHAAKFLV